MVVIRACKEQDLAGLLGLYAELRPRDPMLTPSVASAALRRLLAEPGVMVLPKSSDPARLRENFEAASVTLDAALRQQIDALFPPPRHKLPLAVG